MSLPMFASILGVGVGVLLFVAYQMYNSQSQQTYTNQVPQGHSRQESSYTPPPSRGTTRPRGPARRRSRSPEGDEKSDCTICLQPFSSLTCERTNCNHKFHTECINQWKVYSFICPICRATL